MSAAYPRAHEDEDNLYAYSAVHIATDHYGNTKVVDGVCVYVCTCVCVHVYAFM